MAISKLQAIIQALFVPAPLRQQAMGKKGVAAALKGTSHSAVNRNIILSRKTHEEMITHCKNELPYEACGLISGKNGIAMTCWPMKNVLKSPVSFAMNNDHIHCVFESMVRRGELLLGIYHSHPTGRAYPSKADIAYHNYPEAGYFIVSFAKKEPVLKCFKIIGNKVTELKVELLDR